MKKNIFLASIVIMVIATFACTKPEKVSPSKTDKSLLPSPSRVPAQFATDLYFYGLNSASKNHDVATFIDANGDTILVENLGYYNGLKLRAIYAGNLRQASIVTFKSDTSNGSFEYKWYLYANGTKPDFSHDTPVAEEVIVREDFNNPYTLQYGSINRKFLDKKLCVLAEMLSNGETVSSTPCTNNRTLLLHCGSGESVPTCIDRAVAAAKLKCANEGGTYQEGVLTTNPIDGIRTVSHEYECK